jgi:hypothetical protein
MTTRLFRSLFGAGVAITRATSIVTSPLGERQRPHFVITAHKREITAGRDAV